MSVIEIKQGGTILARHIPAQAAWGEGLIFFSPEQDFIQVGTWGYGAGKELKAHVHNPVTREIHWTQEVLYIRNGRIRARIFDLEDKPVTELEASSGDILVLLCGGHGYEILEDGTQVLEIKNGPFVGPDLDRRRL
jgi:hypothetical protein